MPQHITVVEYSPQWPLKYEREKEKIMAILKENCTAIYHIGSTSVPGLAAKPIIDIMAVVKSLERVDAVSADFSEIGYEYLGEFGMSGRRYLRKGGDERTHQIHIFQMEDSCNIRRHLAFRDYMRTHKKEREKYEKLKRSLAKRFPYDIDGYCDGKEEFVQEIEKRALEQYEKEKGNGGGDVMELKEFTVDDCLRTMYETPSDGAKSNEGKVCIIPLENLAEEYRRPEYQLFRVSGGFGCIPGGIGRACYGRFCIDGERTMWPKGDFLGVANERVERIAEEMEAAWKDRTVEKNMEM